VRALIAFVFVAVAVVAQLTVVDRIAFPGGAGPDLVLLAVAALALASGPMAGALIGFWAGLALDVAPPGSHFVGQDALVFCLIGYACGLLADDSSGDGATEPGHSALFEIVVVAAGAICGEALGALLGVMLSDPRVTWPAITRVLPAAVVYDVLLAPFVLYAVAAAWRLAGARGHARRPGWSAARAGTAVPGAGLGLGTARSAVGGNTPRLRLSDRGKGSMGGLRAAGTVGLTTAKREPRLNLGRAGSVRPAMRTGSMTGLRDGLGTAFATSSLGGSQARLRFGRSSLGRSWLGGSLFSRGPSSSHLSSPHGRSPVFSRSASVGRSSPLRHRGNLMRTPGGLGSRTPRFTRNGSRSSGRGGVLGRLAGPLRGSVSPKSPSAGWLRRPAGGNSLTRRTMGRGAFGRGVFGRGVFGRGSGGLGARQRRLRSGRSGPARLHMPRPKARRKWRTGGYR
jgi:rod shape-determining protein MreD